MHITTLSRELAQSCRRAHSEHSLDPRRLQVKSICMIGGEEQLFSPPLFQTWIMFVGMIFALPMYFGSEWYKRYKAQGDPAALAARRSPR